jgi:hypothetical protein
MNGDEFIRSLDERLRDLETNGAAQTEAVENLEDVMSDLKIGVQEIRDWVNQKKGADKEIAKTAKWSGGVSGGIVSAAFFGIVQGFKTWFE